MIGDVRRSLLRTTAGVTTLMVGLLGAAASQGQPAFLQDRERGYYWYEQPPPPPPEEELVEEAPPPPAPPPPPEEVVTEEWQPQVGSTVWLRDAMDEALRYAMDNPTFENVQRYFLLQHEAMNKAERFAEMAQFVTTGHAILDERARRDGGTIAAMNQGQAARDRLKQTLGRMSETIGLWFFIDATCAECSSTITNLVGMGDDYGFESMVISLDGTGLAGTDLRVVEDTGQAESLGIKRGGALIMVRPPNFAAVVARGVMSRVEMENRLIAIAYRQGWVTEAEYLATRTVRPIPDPLPNPGYQAAPDTYATLRDADRLTERWRADTDNIFPNGWHGDGRR